MREFGTVLNCMDGRVQRKVADYLLTSFGVRNLDTVTAGGMVRHLAGDTERTAAILGDLDISVTRHGSSQIAVAAHHDCAGNPVSDDTQRREIAKALSRLAQLYPDSELVGLWLDRNRTVERIRAQS